MSELGTPPEEPAPAQAPQPSDDVSAARADAPEASSTDAPVPAPAAAGAEAGTLSSAPPPAPPLRPQASGRPVGKVRSPIGCWLLALITFGIYALVWYHHTNKELKEFDPTIQVSPGVAVLALLVPVVNWFSVFNTGKRIRQAQQTAGIPASVSPGLGVVLTFVLALYLPYYVSQTNAVWESAGAR